jgi:hypothetical protein
MALRNLCIPSPISKLESVILKSAGQIQDLAMRFGLLVGVCAEQRRRPTKDNDDNAENEPERRER